MGYGFRPPAPASAPNPYGPQTDPTGAIQSQWAYKNDPNKTATQNQMADAQNQMNYWSQTTPIHSISGGPSGMNYNPFNNQFTESTQDQMKAILTQRMGALNAQNFGENMPGIRAGMVGQLARQSSNQLGSNIGQLNSANASRGMAYGGVAEGQKQALRANAANSMATGTAGINNGLIQEQQQLNNSAIGSGVQLQQQMQAYQNTIYQNAMSSMALGQQVVGGVMGAVGAVAGAYFGGGVGAGAGYAAGNQLGRGLMS